MRTDRKERQNLICEHFFPPSRRTGYIGSATPTLEMNKRLRNSLSEKNLDLVFNNKFRHINVENLYQEFRAFT